jgi:asparagine synthase (glutamine-hydrolysing)
LCGIVGGLVLTDSTEPEGLARSMLQRVARRGPDGDGLYFDGPCLLGHQRLAIIDLSPQGDQPMHDSSGRYCIVFNGTLYNYQPLRAALIEAGRVFRSQSDTEVILNAFAHWGRSCVERLHGEFAFAIWDRQRKSLFLARDRMGIKPLYYTRSSSGFFFASNVQALLAVADCDTRIDPVALHHALTLHGVVPAPATIIRGVRKCAPAHSLTVDNSGGVESRRYWSLRACRPAQKISDEEWRWRIRQALLQAIDLRMKVSDVPVGVLLSGGLDSSLIVALLAELGIDNIRSYSIGFEHHAREPGNEFEYSDSVAQRFATQHQRIHVSNAEILQRLPEVIDNMSEPMFGQDAVAFYLLAQQVSNSVKVVQSGQGADELFAGYSWYARMLASPGTAVQRFAQNYFDRDHDEYLQTVESDYQGDDFSSRLVADALRGQHADTFMDAVLHFDVTTLVVDDPVKRIDNMSMAWGLEARVPFLDQHLVELVAQCPPELKLLHQGKGILKGIARGSVPDAIIDRPKAYFPVPPLKYVSGEFAAFMADILNSRQCLERGLFSRHYIDQLLDQPDAHLTRLNGSKLWQCAVIELWLQKNLN